MCIFNKFSKYTAESGRSMVEMLGVLAIIGVLTVGGVAGYNFAMNKHRANEIIQGVKERAVIGSGQRMNDHAVDFHEFPELIIDYTTSGRNTGLNGEKEFFSVDVADVPQAVCQNVLNMNWDWPSGVFVNGQDIETCPTENSQMTFVFAADLSSKIAQEQDPCLGNSCCMAPDKQPIFGVTMDLYECKGEGQKICCKQTIPNACVYPQHSNYETYVSNAQKAENPTCEQDPKQYCDDLDCKCRACANIQMDQDAACNCSCPNGYRDTPCDAGKYAAEKLENSSGEAVCYKCQTCPGLPPQDPACTYTAGTDANGCPTQTIDSCACDSGYTTAACVAGTTYQVDMKTLTDGTQCYKCAECPELPDQDSDCSYTMGTDENGCPTQTICSCACDSGYTKNACVAGTNYQVDMKTLTDGTQCYKCAECPVSETLEEEKCGIAQTVAGENGCPDRTVYTDIVDMGDCGKCQNGQVVADTSKYNTGCQTCTAENAWNKQNKAEGTSCGECKECNNNGICLDKMATATVKKYGGNNTACCQDTTVRYCSLRGKPANECTGDKVVTRSDRNISGYHGRSDSCYHIKTWTENLCTNSRGSIRLTTKCVSHNSSPGRH